VQLKRGHQLSTKGLKANKRILGFVHNNQVGSLVRHFSIDLNKSFVQTIFIFIRQMNILLMGIALFFVCAVETRPSTQYQGPKSQQANPWFRVQQPGKKFGASFLNRPQQILRTNYFYFYTSNEYIVDEHCSFFRLCSWNEATNSEPMA
jgi:hypothetical protein